MPKATLTSKGQLTLPKEIRSRLGVDAGDQVDFRIEADGSITVLAAKGSARRLYGFLRMSVDTSVSTEDMERAISDYVAADDERIRSENR
jgi:AbrB family looped-hinge helix DNA binding protein